MSSAPIWEVGSVVTIAVAVVGWLLKQLITRLVKSFENQISTVNLWKEGLDKKGGVVTRDDHFDFCGKAQARCSEEMSCRIEEVEEWREKMNDKGGPITRLEHAEIDDKVIQKAAVVFSSMLTEIMKEHRRSVEKELGLIKLTLQNEVLKELKDLKAANGEKK